jgi:hypothetical protein
MSTQLKRFAIPALRSTVSLVVLWESVRLAFGESAGQHFARTGMPAWVRPALAWPEIVAALLFLVPFTAVIGSYSLLAIFGIAAVLHILHGQFDIGVLAVYGAAVFVTLAHKNDFKAGLTHDRE